MFGERRVKTISKLLIVSLFTSTTTYGESSTKYTIKSGDSLWSIASKHHTTVATLTKLNHIKKGDVIKSGKSLQLPLETPPAEIFRKYTIKQGDTLSAIALKHHTTIKKLVAINEIKHENVLKLGKTLKIPYQQPHIASLANVDTVSLKSSKKITKPTLADILAPKKSPILSKLQKIEEVAKEKLGKRYVWGASGTHNTYDCSSFTKYVYRKNGISIPRTSINQSKYGKYIKRENLKKGDLIFFDTSKNHKGYVNHVGIYLGNNQFIHASSAKKKVVITSLNKAFYSQRYKGARRP